jgi:hypothetical protein
MLKNMVSLTLCFSLSLPLIHTHVKISNAPHTYTSNTHTYTSNTYTHPHTHSPTHTPTHTPSHTHTHTHSNKLSLSVSNGSYSSYA